MRQTTIKCDRCGKEVITDSNFPDTVHDEDEYAELHLKIINKKDCTIWSLHSLEDCKNPIINKKEQLDIELCRECEEDFLRWYKPDECKQRSKGE